MKTAVQKLSLVIFISLIAVPSIASGPYIFKDLDPEATHQERLAACQIPGEILEIISTEDLIETCLNYPFKINLMFYNSYTEALAAMIEDFNGFQELLRREDAAGLLLQKYISLNPLSMVFPIKETLSEKELMDVYEPFRNIKLIETLLNHGVIFLKLMDTERKLLAQETINKIHQKRGCPVEYVNPTELDTTAELMTRFFTLSRKNKKTEKTPLQIDLGKDKDVEWLISIVEGYISQ